jgi:hypothetical protein
MKLALFALLVASALIGMCPAEADPGFPSSSLNNDPQPKGWKSANGVDYLALVRAYAETLIEKGRDTYGKVHSPLFAAALSRDSFAIGKFPEIEGIRPGDRITTGANPMTDENLYQILYALSIITKDPRYSAEADKALKFFFEHAQSSTTGLLAWGEHMGWDFTTEGPIRDTHEFARPWVLWDRVYSLTPAACEKFAHGLWDHQIDDQKTGNFSRHAKWSHHETHPNFDFPRHGGFYILTWARAYLETKDPIFLRAIETMVDHYNHNTVAQSGAIRAETSRRYSVVEMWPLSNLSLAVDLTQAAGLIGKFAAPLSAKMLDEAAGIDRTLLALKHNQGKQGEFFVVTADAKTLEPLSDKANDKEHDPYARLWETSYGHYLSSNAANLCHLRYLQLPDGEIKEGYKKLILDCATRYLNSDPDLSCTIYPAALGDAIWLLTDAYNLSKDRTYLQRAEHFAQIAVDKFFPNGVPLPVASSASSHYESITRSDTLMAALLHLWSAKQDKRVELSIIYCDR